MSRLLSWTTRLGGFGGAIGALLSAMGCAMCFPAIATLGTALGLGFLGRWEGQFINTLLPLFAWMVLIFNALGWLAHRQWWRALLGMTGPALLLLSLYPWFRYGWSSYATYAGLGLMLAFPVWDLLWPAKRACAADGCGRTTDGGR